MAVTSITGAAIGTGYASGHPPLVISVKGEAFGRGVGLAIGPPMISEAQSYSWIIRNVLFDALVADPFFAGFICRKTKMLPSRPETLPYLGVYIIDDTQSPDGDGNAGEVRFIDACRIGFSVLLANNDQVVLEAGLDAAWRRINNRLWSDQYIMNLLDTSNPHSGKSNPDNTRIESIERGMRRLVFGAAMANNETPIGELQYDVTVRYREGFPPLIMDELDTIDVKTGIKPGDTSDEMAARLQLHRRYQFFDPSSFAAKREFRARRKIYGR